MLATLVPLFDENLSVSAYSLFSQKANLLTDPRYFVSAKFDGAGQINGLDIIESTGVSTLTENGDVFVPVNNVSIFADINSTYHVPKSRIVILLDSSILPNNMYYTRLKELKASGYKLALWKIAVSQYEDYKHIFKIADYIIINHKKIDIKKAKIYFTNLFPNIKIIAGNIQNQVEFNLLKKDGGYAMFEGPFYRIPVTKGDTDVAPLKMNYIDLLNIVNNPDFDLSEAANVIGRDTALVISLLKIVNRMSVNSEITTINHAAAMLGQKELKKWITTIVTKELCSDKPNEITRLSLIRAKFAENLAPLFNMKNASQELFLLGLFSVIDLILDKPMKDALEIINISNQIKEALICKTGNYAPILDFVLLYESASWQEISRIMILNNINMDNVYNAYINTLTWYRDLFSDSNM